MIVPEVLKRDNYKKWSIFMQHYLVGQDLWDVVQSSQLPAGGNMRREWIKKNALALHAIKISCGEKMFDQIKEMDSAKGVWDALADMHKPQEIVELPVVRTGPENLTMPEYETLTNAISNGGLSEVEKFFGQNPNAKSEKVFENGYTVLHFAVYKRKGRIVKYLIKNKLSKDDLITIKDHVGSTALSVAARFGVGKWIAQKLVKKNHDLLTIPDEDGKIPVQLACSTPDEDMTRYLYRETPLEFLKGDRGFYILQECIIRKMFDIAFDLLHHLPELASHDNCPPGSIPLILTLSKTPPPFLRWSNLSFWNRLIYNWIMVKANVIKEDNHRSRVEKIQGFYQSCVKKSTAFFQSCGKMIQKEIMILKNKIQEMIHKSFKGLCVFLLKQLVMLITVSLRELFWIGMLLLLPVELILVAPFILASIVSRLLKMHLYQLKLMDKYAKKVRRLICKPPQNQLVQSSAVEATFQAIKNGIPLIVKKIIKDNPNILWSSTDPEDSRSRNIFACAVAHRQEHVAHFLYKFADEKNILFSIDENGNNTLHLAAKLPPHYQSGYIHAAALQLRNELRWFKAVKEIVPRAYIVGKNEDNETPLEVFVREHKDLLKEADKWAKKTAQSSTVVGALIITIMFAVAFTVPGGNDQSTGFPILLHKTPDRFMTFMVSDGISLFAASSSVFMFLGILTSHHSDEDYYKSSLLIYGLASLFVSIATMTIAFCAALSIMLQAQSRLGVAIPISMLAVIPIICYMLLQFPLLVEILFLTYGRNIFGKRRTRLMSSAMTNVFTLGLRSLRD